ncbi:ketopantoate reductase family protein [Ferviditalea candida]|uniref:2-dehydropantoate 2-reductase n=1 Tax=Ferviditalea candida TaxID=3108399 RepID=A0ABU5ZJR6_9BACL|nr:ketopantoate reductase family protein [Paenibacillaceae bacterium T2]
MRFLIVGAGAVGGYFGGRLSLKGEDVTFLVRPNRCKRLKEQGLHIQSKHGDIHTPVKVISTEDPAAEPYDVIILAVKAYHFSQAAQDIKRFVGDSTVILPLLNGYGHFLKLQQEFGKNRVLGGLCFIETTLDHDGTIIQTSGLHDVVFGEWDGSASARTDAILEHMSRAGFNVKLSGSIQRDVWHKYIFISSMSGITALMNAPIGPILANEHGRSVYRRLIAEIVRTAKLLDAPVKEDVAEITFKIAESLDFNMKSSMQRDIEKGLSIEADQLQGALISAIVENGGDLSEFPVLQTVYGRLKIYEQTSVLSRA